MNDGDLADDLANLVEQCRQLESEMPAQAAAGKILLFPRLLGSLELLIDRSIGDERLFAARTKLHQAVVDFSSLVFSVQHQLQDWSVGEPEKRRIGTAIHAILVAARELEDLVKHRGPL